MENQTTAKHVQMYVHLMPKFQIKTTTRTQILVLFLCITSLSSLHFLQKYIASQKPYFIKWSWTETIDCHYETEGDALPLVQGFSPPENSIFFHETSCRGGLNSREACSIESAARKHPNRTVFVFFNSPVSEIVLDRSCLAKLRQLRNVRVARLHTTEYAKGTALEELLVNKKNNQSQWRLELTSDMLRYITMYKYGGIYLDTDVLVVKPLDILGRDWVAKEDESTVNVAVLAISREGLGHEIVSQVLEDLRVNYRPKSWLDNGPGAMNRVLLKFCNATIVSDLNAHRCHGFKVYRKSRIYPIHWQDSKIYFKAGQVARYSKKVFTHHLWNKMSRDMAVEKGSLYDKLSWQHCPIIREMYGDKFGL